jgi:putative redox protein
MTLTKKIVIDWICNYRFIAKNEKGLSVNFDAPISFGGEESALSPMENVLGSLAACCSIHILSLLDEQSQKVSSFSVEVQAEREEEPPRAFTKIHLNYTLKGNNMDREVVKKVIETAEENQWSVGSMLKKAVQITSSFELLES